MALEVSASMKAARKSKRQLSASCVRNEAKVMAAWRRNQRESGENNGGNVKSGVTSSKPANIKIPIGKHRRIGISAKAKA
jgi:hypothetical protein